MSWKIFINLAEWSGPQRQEYKWRWHFFLPYIYIEWDAQFAYFAWHSWRKRHSIYCIFTTNIDQYLSSISYQLSSWMIAEEQEYCAKAVFWIWSLHIVKTIISIRPSFRTYLIHVFVFSVVQIRFPTEYDQRECSISKQFSIFRIRPHKSVNYFKLKILLPPTQI